jgi:hypothetical protein
VAALDAIRPVSFPPKIRDLRSAPSQLYKPETAAWARRRYPRFDTLLVL